MTVNATTRNLVADIIDDAIVPVTIVDLNGLPVAIGGGATLLQGLTKTEYEASFEDSKGSHVYTYTAGLLTSDAWTVAGVTKTKTFTYAAGSLTAESAWV